MSQTEKLFNLLKDGRPHSTLEILDVVYGLGHSGIARISARIKDLKDEGHSITGWKDENNPSVYWYQLKAAVSCEREGKSMRLEPEKVWGDDRTESLTASTSENSRQHGGRVGNPASRQLLQGEMCLNLPVIKKNVFHWD